MRRSGICVRVVAVVVAAVALTATGRPVVGEDDVLQDDQPTVEALIPPINECLTDPRGGPELLARIDAVIAAGEGPGTSSGTIVVTEQPDGNVDVAVDGMPWIMAGRFVPSTSPKATPAQDSTKPADGVSQTLQLLNACDAFTEFPFLFSLYTDEGLTQHLRASSTDELNLLRLVIEQVPPVNDHQARSPSGIEIFATKGISDGRIAVVMAITYPQSSIIAPYLVVLRSIDGRWYVDWERNAVLNTLPRAATPVTAAT